MNATASSVLGAETLGPGLSWSPTSDKLAMVLRRSGATDDYDIWTLVIGQPGSATNVTNTMDGTWERLPCFSPDGSEISYWHNTSSIDGVYKISATGGTPVELSDQGRSSDWR